MRYMRITLWRNNRDEMHSHSGTWTSIEEDSSRKDPVTKDVFGLWVDHGVRPEDGSYAY